MTTSALAVTTPMIAKRIFRPEQQTLKFTRLDNRIYSRVAADAPVVDEAVARTVETKKGGLGRSSVESIAFDCFTALHRFRAESAGPGMGSPLAADLIQRWQATEGYQTARIYTVADEVASTLASCAAFETFITAIPEEVKKAAQKEREAREQAENDRVYAESLAEDGDNPQETNDAFEKAERSRMEANEAGDALKRSLRDNGRAIGAAVQAGASKAAEQAETIKAACETFGMGSGDVTGGLPPAMKFELAKKVAGSGAKFRKFADAIGRAVLDAAARQAAKLRHDSGEIVDTILGSEVSELLEDEAASLVAKSPALRRLARARLAQDAMMMHEVESKEPQSKGAIVMLIDESGSMQGQRECEAKAIAIALCHVAMKQRRPFIVHTFQSSVTWSGVIEPGDARKVGPDGVFVGARVLIDLVNRGTNGGTDFDAPLNQACKDLEQREQQRADVLFLTDGISRISPGVADRVNAIRKRLGARVFTMLVGGEAGGATEVVRPVSDRVWSADALLNPNGVASGLFDAI